MCRYEGSGAGPSTASASTSGPLGASRDERPTASASIHIPGSTPASRIASPSAARPDGNRSVLTRSQSPRCSCQSLPASAAPNHPASTVAISIPRSAATRALSAMTCSVTSSSSYGHQWFHSTGIESVNGVRGSQAAATARWRATAASSRSVPTASTTLGATTVSPGEQLERELPRRDARRDPACARAWMCQLPLHAGRDRSAAASGLGLESQPWHRAVGRAPGTRLEHGVVAGACRRSGGTRRPTRCGTSSCASAQSASRAREQRVHPGDRQRHRVAVVAQHERELPHILAARRVRACQRRRARPSPIGPSADAHPRHRALRHRRVRPQLSMRPGRSRRRTDAAGSRLRHVVAESQHRVGHHRPRRRQAYIISKGVAWPSTVAPAHAESS